MNHASPPTVPNATAAALLGLLHRGPMTGWDLAAAVERRIGSFWSVTRSQVYRELKAMTATGLVEPGEAGARDARPFHVTDDGRAAFAEWIARDPSDESVRMPLLLSIAFSAHLEREELDAMLDRQRVRHEANLAKHLDDERALRSDPTADVTALATVDFGIRHERSVLEWLDALGGILDQGRTES